MKIKVDVDCTPEEARTFLGLPDVRPLQEAMMDEVKARMLGNLKSMDPDTMMKTWLPMGMQGMENLQKMFWSQMTSGKNPADGTKDD